MASIIFSLAYTTRRGHLIPDVINLWRNRAVNPERVEIVLCIDQDDVQAHQIARCLNNVKVVTQTVPPFNCVRGWNTAAANTTGKVIVCVADDFTPPRAWDSLLLGLRPDTAQTKLQRMANGLDYPSWVDGDFILHVDDGFVRTIPTLAIVTRARYDKFGYIFYPGYESLFCDTELGERAKLDGAVVDGMSLLFEHVHPSCNKRSQDQVDLVHASSERWQRGEALFKLRKSMGFPADNEKRTARRKFAAYVQAVKDDFCLYEVCLRLVEEGVTDFFFCVPDEYWSGRAVTEAEFSQVDEVHKRLNQLGLISARLKTFDVSSYRAPGLNRIQVETALRNDSLAWIRGEGFNHILIVDGDELWRRSLLGLINQVIDQEIADIIACHMVPVIGLPGYPIDNAQDKVTVYVGNGVNFHDCRSAHGKRATLGFPGVIHFTATRRTMDEIIQKHRESGHYDDPNYDFEGWITHTLPNAKPGMVNAHMYRPMNGGLWPSVRNWTAEELKEIPNSVHKYLGVETVTAAPIQFNPPPVTEPQTNHGIRKAASFPPSRTPTKSLYRRL